MIERALVDHYRCPEHLVTMALAGDLCSDSGHLRVVRVPFDPSQVIDLRLERYPKEPRNSDARTRSGRARSKPSSPRTA